jgi:hypothetical protein
MGGSCRPFCWPFENTCIIFRAFYLNYFCSVCSFPPYLWAGAAGHFAGLLKTLVLFFEHFIFIIFVLFAASRPIYGRELPAILLAF